MDNILHTILPASLRTQCKGYCFNDIKNRANRFVVINIVGITVFEVRMRVWVSTHPRTQNMRSKVLITLRKDTGEKDCDRLLEQESANILRKDEFEWLLRESMAFLTYSDMIEYATLGNTAAITIYLYLLELAKLFHMEPSSIFKFIDNFRLGYNSEELMKKPW